jgi:RNA polymerase sigma factor (sigma-70 family)
MLGLAGGGTLELSRIEAGFSWAGAPWPLQNGVMHMALQRIGRKPYDTACRADVCTAQIRPMDEPRSGPNATSEGGGLPAEPVRLDSTLELVTRARTGDREALDSLFARCLPSLRRWASGRLPRSHRDLLDTDDLVQETVIRTVKRIDAFEPRHEGALQAYLRQAVMNRIRDEIRRSVRGPQSGVLDSNEPDRGASPLDEAIGAEAVERYEAALARLRPEEREAVVTRIEMDGSYATVAQALGKPSADAARMAVGRALLRLAEEMSRGV